jgi:hypothetical protein
VKTSADLVIQITEDAINSYLTTSQIPKEAMNPANVRAAIRQLRASLKPFVAGGVDAETAKIIPADLDEKLAAREQEIALLRLPAESRRNLAFACQLIGTFLKQVLSTSGEAASEDDILRFIDTALSMAGIKHPDLKKHRSRFAALVFPKSSSDGKSKSRVLKPPH